jgi:hypothetical protein
VTSGYHARVTALVDWLARNDASLAALLPVLRWPAGTTSAGFPFLSRPAWETFRDGVPHLFEMGHRTLAALDRLDALLADAPDREAADDALRSSRVMRQVVLTAAITAPPDLWLLRHVLGFFGGLGLLERQLHGDALYPDACSVTLGGVDHALSPTELDTDLQLLLSRGIVEQYENSYRIAGHERVRELLRAVPAFAPVPDANPTGSWRRLFAGDELALAEQEMLLGLALPTPRRRDASQNHWVPTVEEVELGYRLVPLVLGLRAAGRTAGLGEGRTLGPRDLSERYPVCAAGALEVLAAVGWVVREGERYSISALGARGFERGPGPFGIIETYWPYMRSGREILLHGRARVHVNRSENVGASQDANRHTFKLANDALDRFCADTGFSYRVFIEHAIGRGEAIRQRFERSGSALRYVGADLEDPAIDAAVEEQRQGRLPADMLFVRNADIGRPAVLVDALRAAGLEPDGAVMLVGNGFHEVRDQTDEGMVDVFRGYHDAGIVILFTEENALSIDDLRATAWNTYHSGFRYVHEKSGQALRPAEPTRPVRLGHPLRAAWSDCASRAGYVKAERYGSRTRTIYPYRPAGGHNPSISANHFFVPGALARRLGL